jgi:hypothetical protein
VGQEYPKKASVCRRPFEVSSVTFGTSTNLFPASLPRQSLLDPLLLARLQVEGMPFDFLDDVFLLHFSFEASECVLDRLALLNSHFSH